MVKSFLSRANKPITISTAAALIGTSYFASALLGLIRDRLLAARFGIGGTLDAYFAAFSVPDLMFYLLVSGALSVAFIPVISERLVKGNKKSVWQISSSMLNFLAITTFIGSVLIFIFADPLMWMVAPKFDLARHNEAVALTRIIALNPFLFSISTVFASMQQAFGRFFFFAIAPVTYNLGIILGIVFLSPKYGITGVAVGVFIGAIAQLLIQRLGIIGLGFKYQHKIFWKNKGFRQVIRLMIPRSIDEGVEYMQAVIERAIASGLAVGSIAAYQYAFNLKNMPITLFGVAIATAAFPKISETVAMHRTDLLKNQIVRITESLLWTVVPTAVLFVVFRGYIVRLLFGFGDPTTASILGWFAGAIIFQSLLKLVARVFYANQDTKTPLYTSIAALTLNVVLAIWLSNVFGVTGLAMAQSLVAGFEAILLMVVMRRRLGPFSTMREFWLHTGKITIASLTSAAVGYMLIRYGFPLISGEVGFWSLAPKFIVVGSISVITYLMVGWSLKISETRIVVNKVLQFFLRPLRIQ